MGRIITRASGLYSVVDIAVPPRHLSLEIGYPARLESDDNNDNDGILCHFVLKLGFAAVVGPSSKLSRCRRLRLRLNLC